MKNRNENKIFVRVIKCSHDSYWYSDKKGLVAEVVQGTNDDTWEVIKFWTWEMPEKRPNFYVIQKMDCEMVPGVPPYKDQPDLSSKGFIL